MSLNRDEFHVDDLIKLGETDYVILASGGPLMRLVCVEGENTICEWPDGNGIRQSLFPLASLRRLVRLDPPPHPA